MHGHQYVQMHVRPTHDYQCVPPPIFVCIRLYYPLFEGEYYRWCDRTRTECIDMIGFKVKAGDVMYVCRARAAYDPTQVKFITYTLPRLSKIGRAYILEITRQYEETF